MSSTQLDHAAALRGPRIKVIDNWPHYDLSEIQKGKVKQMRDVIVPTIQSVGIPDY